MKNQSNTTSAKGQSETFASLWPVVNVEYKASFTFLLNFFLQNIILSGNWDLSSTNICTVREPRVIRICMVLIIAGL